jgi:hypothetical protein
MKNNFVLSSLNHTWIIDIDGTIAKHNGYKIDGKDTLLPGVREFFQSLDNDDMVIFLTSRTIDMKEKTEEFLRANAIRYNYIIYGAPYGERIIVNDDKPSGLEMSKAICLKRNAGIDFVVSINNKL